MLCGRVSDATSRVNPGGRWGRKKPPGRCVPCKRGREGTRRSWRSQPLGNGAGGWLGEQSLSGRIMESPPTSHPQRRELRLFRFSQMLCWERARPGGAVASLERGCKALSQPRWPRGGGSWGERPGGLRAAEPHSPLWIPVPGPRAPQARFWFFFFSFHFQIRGPARASFFVSPALSLSPGLRGEDQGQGQAGPGYQEWPRDSGGGLQPGPVASGGREAV